MGRISAVTGTAAVLTAVAAHAACNSHNSGSAAPETSASAAAPQKLDGTSWQLLQIQSSDDAQGITTVDDPSKFTVSFGPDGQAAIKLDCNTGGGSWTAEPAEGGESGTLTFGPIRQTLMACGDGSLDGRVGQELSNVTGYLFRDGQLHLSTKFDGSTLTWRPTPS